MSVSARQLRTGADAGAPRLGARNDARNAPVYVDPTPPTSGSFAFAATIGSSASFDVVLHANSNGPAFPTGQDTMAAPHPTPVRSWFPLIDLSMQPTGYGWMLAPVLCAFVSEGDASDLDETDEPSTTVLLPRAAIRLAATPESTPEAAAAMRVRELSGLQAEKLAELFGVTRTAFYGWLRGVKPRGRRRDHLLQVAHLVEEAARRLGGPREVAAWLMAPSPASNRVPFELVRDHQYDLARSLLTRRRRAALPVRARTRLGRAELREALDRVTARPSSEDYEDIDE